jgi:hypothetical protein
MIKIGKFQVVETACFIHDYRVNFCVDSEKNNENILNFILNVKMGKNRPKWMKFGKTQRG